MKLIVIAMFSMMGASCASEVTQEVGANRAGIGTLGGTGCGSRATRTSICFGGTTLSVATIEASLLEEGASLVAALTTQNGSSSYLALIQTLDTGYPTNLVSILQEPNASNRNYPSRGAYKLVRLMRSQSSFSTWPAGSDPDYYPAFILEEYGLETVGDSSRTTWDVSSWSALIQKNASSRATCDSSGCYYAISDSGSGSSESFCDDLSEVVSGVHEGECEVYFLASGAITGAIYGSPAPAPGSTFVGLGAGVVLGKEFGEAVCPAIGDISSFATSYICDYFVEEGSEMESSDLADFEVVTFDITMASSSDTCPSGTSPDICEACVHSMSCTEDDSGETCQVVESCSSYSCCT